MVSVPSELRAKLEPAEVYHEVLEHRWFLSEQSGVEVPIQKAAETYINTVLRRLPDEEVAMSALASMGPWPTRSTRPRALPTRSTRSRTTPGRTRKPPAWTRMNRGRPDYLDIAALRAKSQGDDV